MSHIFYWGRGIFTLHHGRSRVASFRFTCPHLQVDFHSESSPVDSPADIFIHSSFLFLFFPERGNRNAFYPRCPPRNSVRRWQKKTKKTEDLWNNLLLSAPPLWLLKIMNSEPHSHSCTAKWGGASAPVLGQWRTEKPYHTYPRLANGAPLPGSHDASLCALSPLSARSRRVRASLKTWHRRDRTSAVLGRI